MNTSGLRNAAISSMLTAACLTGAVIVVFILLANADVLTHALPDVSLWVAIPVGVLLLSSAFLIGGGIWGWGTAHLFNHPRWPAARTGALSVTGMFMLLEVPVHFSQAIPVPDWMPLDTHGMFTVVFATEIGLVAGVASARLAKRLGVIHKRRQLAAKVGLAGVIGTVVGSMLALSCGFRVGQSPPFSMVWALYIVVAVAGLTSGWILGLKLTNLAHHTGKGTPTVAIP